MEEGEGAGKSECEVPTASVIPTMCTVLSTKMVINGENQQEKSQVRCFHIESSAGHLCIAHGGSSSHVLLCDVIWGG